MAITAMPTDYPSRANQSQETFNANVAALMGWWPTFVSDVNSTVTEMSGYAADAVSAGTTSAVWVSGTTYAVGNVRYSPINFSNYRRKTAGAGTTDPSLDSTNWASTYVLSDPVFTGVVTGGTGFKLTGASARYTGDLSNATASLRAAFQTSTVNGGTIVSAIPNGTSVASAFRALSSGSDPDNCSELRVGVTGSSEAYINSNVTGSGSYLPIAIKTSNITRINVAVGGDVSVSSTLAVTGVLTASAGCAVGSFTVATRPAHASGLIIRVSDGGAGAICQISSGGAWVNLG